MLFLGLLLVLSDGRALANPKGSGLTCIYIYIYRPRPSTPNPKPEGIGFRGSGVCSGHLGVDTHSGSDSLCLERVVTYYVFEAPDMGLCGARTLATEAV